MFSREGESRYAAFLQGASNATIRWSQSGLLEGVLNRAFVVLPPCAAFSSS
jgi:hypothetical protein